MNKLFHFLLPLLFLTGGKYDPDNIRLADELKGKKKLLKVDVVRLEKDILNNFDATHIHADSMAYYYWHESSIFGKPTKYKSADDYVMEYHTRLRTFKIVHWRRGEKVTIHKVSLDNDRVRVGVTNSGGGKSTIHLDLETALYTPKEINRFISYALADSAAELQTSETVKIEIGMTTDEVIKVKGNPKTRAEIGEKTIFIYDDIKVIFINGKLTDVQ